MKNVFGKKHFGRKNMKRDSLEKFYTDPKISLECIKTFVQKVKPKNPDIILEPSAGNGSFSSYLFDMFENVEAIDIEPDEEKIKKMSFFDYQVTKKTQIVHVIGNPPFGRQSTLAKQFIKKAASFAESITFILPKSFRKESMQNAFPKNFHLLHEEDIPSNAFLVNKVRHNVPCILQIWVKKNYDRSIPKKEIPTYYSFVKKSESHTFSLRRVGGTAGTLDFNTKNKSEQSHYFVRLLKSQEDFEHTYNFHKNFRHDNTTGPKSISKTEFIRYLNSLYI